MTQLYKSVAQPTLLQLSVRSHCGVAHPQAALVTQVPDFQSPVPGEGDTALTGASEKEREGTGRVTQYTKGPQLLPLHGQADPHRLFSSGR